MARPAGSPNKDKPFREALRMEALLAEQGEESPAKKGSLRWIARKMLERAGDETAAAREIADRLDGKPAQAIVGGGEDEPDIVVISRIELVALDGPKLDGPTD